MFSCLTFGQNTILLLRVCVFAFVCRVDVLQKSWMCNSISLQIEALSTNRNYPKKIKTMFQWQTDTICRSSPDSCSPNVRIIFRRQQQHKKTEEPKDYQMDRQEDDLITLSMEFAAEIFYIEVHVTLTLLLSCLRLSLSTLFRCLLRCADIRFLSFCSFLSLSSFISSLLLLFPSSLKPSFSPLCTTSFES